MLQRFGFQCAGVEASPEAVKAANALSNCRGQQIELRLFNQDGSLPFPDDYFDLVISSHAIYHGLDMALTKREVRRVLKDGGRFLFDFWDPESEEMRGTEVVQSTEARSLGIVMRTKNPESELFGVSRLVYPNRQLLLDEFQHDFENVKVEKNSYDVAGHYTSWLYVSGKVRKEKKGQEICGDAVPRLSGALCRRAKANGCQINRAHRARMQQSPS